jgi:hypothetical protein
MKGVDATVAKGKRVETVKVPITGPDGTTIEVDGKACTKCGKEKALRDFGVDKKLISGTTASCNKCRSEYAAERRKRANPTGTRRKRTYWTSETFKAHLFDITDGEYLLVGAYAGTDNHTDVLHQRCGKVWPVRPNSLLQGSRCPTCSVGEVSKSSAETRKRTDEDFVKEVNEIVGDEYSVVGKYVGYHLQVNMRHNLCGHVWAALPSNFLSAGNRCPICAAVSKRKTHAEFVEEVHALAGAEYTVLSAYSRGKDKIRMRHNDCGREWNLRAGTFLSGGRRCPYCKSSRGELRVLAYLESHGYVFSREYKIDDCRDKERLPFDFAVIGATKMVLIEYDGEQHFQPVAYSGNTARAERQFHDRQRKDDIKTDYCRANGIDLIRIRYDQFDEIEEILNRRLTALDITGKCLTQNASNTNTTEEVA